MNKNEFQSIDDFISQYTGEWAPSESHWFGLDFLYKGKEYRFNTGNMYQPTDTVLPDGRVAMFGLYERVDEDRYVLLEEFASVEDALNSTCVNGVPFKNIIIDENTELLGQD